MNRTQLKAYAPAARRDFITAITNRARTLGITEKNIAEAKVEGDVLMIDGRPHPVALAPLRKKLVERINLKGFDQVIQAMAYTWFNRFVAIRYMEIHGYLDHGYRVLSHPQGQSTPEILQQASHVELPGLNKEQVIDLQLDGNKDAELYRMLLIAQCNALNTAMPFLFERLDDETELLLPDNLLHSDSVIRQLVNRIDESNWQEIEIIGWLYQFYISERKDEVMGKVVSTADIPAATQLFTPNWIVKYLVQNSIGAQWLATYPDSDLKEKLEYYIEPAEQTESVQQQLAAITPDELNPEELTLIDPACGSGHILVEAYDLFKELYRERGYPRHKIPKLILEKNLFGLDIDTRAAQMAGFALLMKARADSPRVLSSTPKLNIAALHDSGELDDQTIAEELYRAAVHSESAVESGQLAVGSGQLFGGVDEGVTHSSGLAVSDIQALIQLFENGTTFGSLLTVPEELKAKLPQLETLLEQVLESGNALAQSHAREVMEGFLKPAQLLAAQYDAVVANPPYMGGKGMNSTLKKFAKDFYKDAKADLFACFIERGFTLAKPEGHNAMVTIQNWMFLSSYQVMRESIIKNKLFSSLIQIGYNSFPELNSKIVQCAAFSIRNNTISEAKSTYVNLNSAPQSANKHQVFINRDESIEYTLDQSVLRTIPGSPIAYWVSQNMRNSFASGTPLSELGSIGKGLDTGDNDLFLRLWWEVNSISNKWVACLKGGDFRKWYGNNNYKIVWDNNGERIREHKGSNIRNEKNYFKSGIAWSRITTHIPSFRRFETGHIFESTSPCAFVGDENYIVGFLNSKVCVTVLKILSPTIDFQSGHISSLPLLTTSCAEVIRDSTKEAVRVSEVDWNSEESSTNFQTNPLIATNDQHPTIQQSYTYWQTQNQQTITQMQQLEEENNRLFIDAYGLQDELTPDVPIEQITLTVNPPYRYAKGKTDAEYETLFRTDTMRELVSYAIGCMMGRYSLSAPGLIYAHSGGQDFQEVYDGKVSSSQLSVGSEEQKLLTENCPLKTENVFTPDEDGIIPITDTDWFADDVCNRLLKFIETAWPREKRDENLRFLAEGLGIKSGEAPVDALRRYLSKDFFKDHLKTYKKRPIYWLFSSGKHKAFECLVYLHRYNEGTLSRMRVDYVQPLLGKYESRIKLLRDNIEAASSTAARKKMEKECTLRQNQQLELRKYDEQLRHYTDQRIPLDLDDGVKVNYDKFGTLLANVNDVTGKKA
ncbi:BREX-1 system adenine-specific DNA-methyltransferase PglX [Pelagibaculum spongiae]|uniref:site-specific DNA-methyltransferase (adenine-specific) n=1 Tax=Pelagibaculum spongiae TaxID=2080658 RepID=A0A2V1GZI7_9GAMM|nr:BREX-1 system adenine-specific DNA-methyltransferase PglX [Pelagibaculum spongiae]PVZ66780.1 BREX-1 system adenine-specific DNA-methyltransferase PglX [Pelagibaculum spongiae]